MKLLKIYLLFVTKNLKKFLIGKLFKMLLKLFL